MSQEPEMTKAVFKVCLRSEWTAAVDAGRYQGSPDDARDGYIHLSTAGQLPGTVRKYFAGMPDLLVIAFDPARLGDALRWEPSRGGELFPHFYGSLDPSLALWLREAPLGPDGLPIVPLEVATC